MSFSPQYIAPPHEEHQYLNLISTILQTGTKEKTRNGETISIFGYSMRFSLRNGILPALTTKKVLWKTCWEELQWFIRGGTNIHELHEKGVNIWDNDCPDKTTGELGPIYGFQWRHFNGDERCDQLQQVIDALVLAKNPEIPASRRIILSAWNPQQLEEMALPPCHILAQFNVRENKYLSCALYQRSGDVGLGVPFNILSYAFLTHLLAHHCGLEADEFVHFLGNAHIYAEHTNALMEQYMREPTDFPTIRFRGEPKTNIEDYTAKDIEWTTPYIHAGFLKMPLK